MILDNVPRVDIAFCRIFLFFIMDFIHFQAWKAIVSESGKIQAPGTTVVNA